MLDLSIRQGEDGTLIHIRVNSEQRIEDTLQILSEREILREWDESPYIATMRLKDRVNIRLTYSQAGIYTGDILYLP